MEELEELGEPLGLRLRGEAVLERRTGNDVAPLHDLPPSRPLLGRKSDPPLTLKLHVVSEGPGVRARP